MTKNAIDAVDLLRRSQFAPDFRWGCATSAYQIEGAAALDGRGESIWDRFCTVPGAIRDGSDGSIACDHFHRWPQDLDLARDLGLNAYRFSIAWPRIFAHGRASRPNGKGLDFYSRLVDGMLERGIEPWATLYHWDLPQALQERGGWIRRDTAQAFADYAHALSAHLGDRVKHWITHNEPWCTAFLGNLEGVHAPGIRDWATALQVCHHVLLSHGMAIAAVRANHADAQVGIALSLHPLRPATPGADDLAAVRRHDGLRNRWFLDPLYGRSYPQDIAALLGDLAPARSAQDLATIATPTDFLGVNYYFPETVAHAAGAGPLSARVVLPDSVERTDLGWEVSTQGLLDLLRRVTDDYRPARIFLTENGSCYDDVLRPDGSVDDAQRQHYLARHLAAAQLALAQGIPLQGYFAWSLIDNFEWAEGYTRRFGLAYVDFATLERHLKHSGSWYRSFLHR